MVLVHPAAPQVGLGVQALGAVLGLGDDLGRPGPRGVEDAATLAVEIGRPAAHLAKGGLGGLAVCGRLRLELGGRALGRLSRARGLGGGGRGDGGGLGAGPLAGGLGVAGRGLALLARLALRGLAQGADLAVGGLPELAGLARGGLAELGDLALDGLAGGDGIALGGGAGGGRLAVRGIAQAPGLVLGLGPQMRGLDAGGLADPVGLRGGLGEHLPQARGHLSRGGGGARELGDALLELGHAVARVLGLAGRAMGAVDGGLPVGAEHRDLGLESRDRVAHLLAVEAAAHDGEHDAGRPAAARHGTLPGTGVSAGRRCCPVRAGRWRSVRTPSRARRRWRARPARAGPLPRPWDGRS